MQSAANYTETKRSLLDGGGPSRVGDGLPFSGSPGAAFLATRGAVLLLALLAALIALPTVGAGLIGDDFLFKALLTGQAHQPHPGAFFGLFTFADGNPAHVQHLKDIGQVPWWAADQARMSFWRPLSELTHALDYRWWPASPLLMHLHSVLWYGLLVALLGRLYRTLGGDRLQSGVATLIFALSALHLMTVVWLAARNQLIAGCLVVSTVQFFHQWRRGQGRRHALFALLSLGLGLLAAEAAIAAMAYLVAYVVVFESDRPWRVRVLALLPFVLVVALWRAEYTHLGYGSAETGGYIDPLASPSPFVHALMLRLPSLLLAYLHGVTSSTLGALPDAARPAYAWCAVVLVGMGIMVGHYFGVWARPLARFYGLGALLSLLPVCAAESNDRLLLNAEFGLSAVLAMLFLQVVRAHRSYQGVVAWAAKAWVGLLALVHLLAYPAAAIGVGVVTPSLVRRLEHDEPLSLPDIPVGMSAHVILMNPPDALFVGYYPWVRHDRGLGNAASTQALASGDQALTIEVLDERTLRMTAPQGLGESVSRDFVRHPFHPGEQVHAGAFLAQVKAVTQGGKPRVVDFVFDIPLRSPSLKIFQWSDAGYVPWLPTSVGHAVTLPAVNAGKLAAKRIQAAL